MLASGPLLTLIRVPQEAYEQARTYCMVVLGGIIGTLGYNMNSGIMRGLGDSRTPLIFLFIACVINIVLDLVFVLVFSWGVFGVALATILAQICSWVFGIFYINESTPSSYPPVPDAAGPAPAGAGDPSGPYPPRYRSASSRWAYSSCRR